MITDSLKFTLAAIFRGPGGFDLLADNLLTLEVSAGIGWDLVVIDHDHDRVATTVPGRYLRDRGLPLTHYGTPKLATHPWAVGGYANAVNTAVMYATGQYVVFLDQYAWYPSKLLDWWGGWLGEQLKPAIACSTAVEYDAPPPSGDPIITWPERRGSPLEWWTPRRPAVPVAFDLRHWIAPVELFERCNGLDERTDFDDAWCLGNAVTLAKVHGHAAGAERRIIYHRADPRPWGCCRKPKTGAPSQPPWTGWAANPYIMRDMRAMLERQRQAEAARIGQPVGPAAVVPAAASVVVDLGA